jgi:acid phosphatase (class A)
MKNLHLPFNQRLAPILFALAIAIAPLRAGDSRYLPVGEPDPIALLAPPPLTDSPEQAADLAEVQSIAHTASSNETASAMTEVKFSAFSFKPEIGDFFLAEKLPTTEAFCRKVQKEAAGVVDIAKEYWKRPRPFTVDPTLATGNLEKSFGYPSGHSTESMVLALVLADLFPEHHDAIVAKARLIGWHRVELGRHYPTDIYAGRVLAKAIYQEMKQTVACQKDLAAVKAEIAAAQKAAAKN